MTSHLVQTVQFLVLGVEIFSSLLFFLRVVHVLTAWPYGWKSFFCRIYDSSKICTGFFRSFGSLFNATIFRVITEREAFARMNFVIGDIVGFFAVCLFLMLIMCRQRTTASFQNGPGRQRLSTATYWEKNQRRHNQRL